MARGRPTQQRSITTRAHRCEVARLEGRSSVSDTVDAAMLPKERASSQAPLDRSGRHSGPKQLGASHHSVRCARDPCQSLLHCPALRSHYDL
jgi:hypothetical protein